jgi:hypothetical protein
MALLFFFFLILEIERKLKSLNGIWQFITLYTPVSLYFYWVNVNNSYALDLFI